MGYTEPSWTTVPVVLQVNKNFFELKSVECRDAIKSKET